MSWFRVDDKAAFNAKVLAAGNEAFGAWTRAGSWSAGMGTDGRIPDQIASVLAKKSIWKRLESVGLVERIEGESGGFQIHDYLDWNPSAKEVETARQAKQAAGARGGASRAASKTLAPASQLLDPPPKQKASEGVAISHPIPTHPNQERSESEQTAPPGDHAPRARVAGPKGSRMPEDYEPKPETVADLEREGMHDPRSVLPSFRDYWRSAPGQKGVKLDWEATFRNWVRRDKVPRANGRIVQQAPAGGPRYEIGYADPENWK